MQWVFAVIPYYSVSVCEGIGGDIVDVAKGNMPSTTRYISAHFLNLIVNQKIVENILPDFERPNMNVVYRTV